MTAPLSRLPALRAAIAFLEKIWEPMLHIMPQPQLVPVRVRREEPYSARVAVEFGVHVARRQRPAPRITIRDWC